MTTKELLAVVEARGLRIDLEDGRPVIFRPKGNDGLTDALLAVLKRHRDWIVQELTRRQNGVQA